MPHAETVTGKSLRRRPAPAVRVQRCAEAGKVWLQHRDGEGGAFDARAVARVIRRKENLATWFWKNF